MEEMLTVMSKISLLRWPTSLLHFQIQPLNSSKISPRGRKSDVPALDASKALHLMGQAYLDMMNHTDIVISLVYLDLCTPTGSSCDIVGKSEVMPEWINCRCDM